MAVVTKSQQLRIDRECIAMKEKESFEISSAHSYPHIFSTHVAFHSTFCTLCLYQQTWGKVHSPPFSPMNCQQC